jgi:hypothetical protein
MVQISTGRTLMMCVMWKDFSFIGSVRVNAVVRVTLTPNPCRTSSGNSSPPIKFTDLSLGQILFHSLAPSIVREARGHIRYHFCKKEDKSISLRLYPNHLSLYQLGPDQKNPSFLTIVSATKILYYPNTFDSSRGKA